MVRTVDSEGGQGTLPLGAKKLYFQNVGNENECEITFKNPGNDQVLRLQPNAILNLEYSAAAYPAIAYDSVYRGVTRLQIVAVY